MTTLSPGCLCRCRQGGAQLFVVGRVDDGIRWKLRGRRIDHRGKSDVTCRVAGAGRSLPFVFDSFVYGGTVVGGNPNKLQITGTRRAVNSAYPLYPGIQDFR